MFVVQYGLYKLWESYGVKPQVVVGHSIGEIAAYCVAGGCSLADALRLVSTRGELMQRLEAGGGMTSVSASAHVCESMFAESGVDLSIAAYNGPNQTVVSGSLEELSRFADRAMAIGIKTQPLKVSHAFHSKLMEPMLDEFRSVISKLALGVPSIDFISTVTGRSVRNELATPDYWVDQVRQPVRFMQAMEKLTSDPVSHFVEIGPHPVLLTMARSMELPNTFDSTRWLSSARRGQKDWSVFLHSIAELVVDGYRIDWKSAERPYARRRVSVPGFEFANRRIWLDEMNVLVPKGESNLTSVDLMDARPSGDRLLYKTRWIRSGNLEQDLSSGGLFGKIKNWLILSLGDGGLAKGLESQLQNEGSLVRLVSWDAQKNVWNVSADDLRAADRIVLVVEDNEGNIQRLCEEQLGAFSKALELAKSASNSDDSSGTAQRVFWLLTQGASMIGSSPALRPLASVLWGGAKVASIEMAEYWGGAIDLNGPLGHAINLMKGQSSEDQMVLLGNAVWVPRLERLLTDAKNSTQSLGNHVLITGGLGAIGLRFAQYAVAQGARYLVLVGRNAQPNSEQLARLESWRKQGVTVQLVSADVSSQEGFAKLTAALNGLEIHSVFHTAGVDFLAPIAHWSTEDIQRVTQVKIQGAWGLHQWSLTQPIRRFVLTSSISSVWGAPERFLYAAANAFLDALGDLRVKMNLPVTVFNFGPWSDGGMADPASLEEYRTVGMIGLDPTETIEAIDKVLSEGQAQAVITDTQWERFVSVMSARRVRPFFDMVLSQEDAPDWSQVPEGARLVQMPAASQPWLRQLAPLDKDKQTTELKLLLRKELSEILKSQEERIGMDKNLYRMGLDSITAVELSMRIKRGTGLAAGKWLVGEPTIESLSHILLENLTSKWTPRDTESQQNLAPQRIQAPWVLELAGIPGSDERREHLMGLFRRELERYVGKSAAHLQAVSRMSDLGLDSLGAVDFATHLRKQLGLKSPPRLMQFATVGDWVGSILGSYDQGVVDGSTTQAVVHEQALGVQLQDRSNRVGDPIEVVRYEPSVHAKVMDFIAEAWPDRNKGVQSSRWDWMYIESAKRLQTKPMVWLAKDHDKVVGHMGAQFAMLKTPNEELLTGWLVDTMVLDAYRTTGLGAQILLQAEEDMPVALSLGQTAEARRMLESLGWRQVCPLHIHVFMNNPGRVLRGKFPMGLDRLAAVYFGWNAARKRALQASRDQQVQIRRIDRFGESHDALWERMRRDISCLAVRDSSFLNWKYLEQPGQSYDCWEVSRSQTLLGIVVTKTESESRVYPYRRLHWVDLVCDLAPKTLDTVIQACIAKSQELKVDAISVPMTNRRIEERLVQQGFVRRPETRYLYGSLGLIESNPRLLSEDWLVTLGDSDIDRPQ
jgi:short-subunit dehydrogenase/acyl carrier protein